MGWTVFRGAALSAPPPATHVPPLQGWIESCGPVRGRYETQFRRLSKCTIALADELRSWELCVLSPGSIRRDEALPSI